LSVGRNALVNLAGTRRRSRRRSRSCRRSLSARRRALRLPRHGLGAGGLLQLIDLGLGRTLAKLVAERRGTPREAELPAASRTALVLTLALGLAAASSLCSSPGRLPPRAESLGAPAARRVSALRVLALCLPLVTLTAALRGLLEAAGVSIG